MASLNDIVTSGLLGPLPPPTEFVRQDTDFADILLKNASITSLSSLTSLRTALSRGTSGISLKDIGDLMRPSDDLARGNLTPDIACYMCSRVNNPMHTTSDITSLCRIHSVKTMESEPATEIPIRSEPTDAHAAVTEQSDQDERSVENNTTRPIRITFLDDTPEPDINPDDVEETGDDSMQGIVDDDGVTDKEMELIDKEASGTDSAPDFGDEESICDKEDEAMEADVGAPEVVPPMPHFGGPAPIEIVISFDTTGSMSSVLDAVKESIRDTLTRLFMDIPSLKVALLAHGDYCDEHEFYLTKQVDLTGDLDALCTFVRDVEGTGGGDWEECYEYILQEARKFQWSPGTQRALVMIGDAIPHTKDSPENRYKLDWREEADKLYQQMDVHVYAVQCRHEAGAGPFWEELADRTMGRHLKLDQFGTIVDILMAICYREAGAQSLDAFEMEVRRREGALMRAELNDVFGALRQNGGAGSSGVAHAAPTTKKAKKSRIGSKSKPVVAKKVRPTKTAAKATASDANATRCKPTAVHKVDKACREVRDRKRATTGKKLVRVPREVLPESKSALHHLTWSRWQLAMTPHSPPHQEASWIPRRASQAGMRRKTLFRGQTGSAALYEVAVQPFKRCKRYVTYLIATTGIPDDRRWDTYLLRNSRINARITNILNQNGVVYIRRALISENKSVKVADGLPVKGVRAIKREALKHNDYAWNRRSHRSITRQGTVM